MSEKYEDFDRLRCELLRMIDDKDMLFASVDEAIELLAADRGTADMLHNDPVVVRNYRRRIIREKASLRAAMLKDGKAGNDKNAKAIMSIMADDMEWAKLNGKSFKQLTIGETETITPIQIISPDVKQLSSDTLKQLYDDKIAEEAQVMK